MSGAASQCDTFDYKPRLIGAQRREIRSRRQGRAVPEQSRRGDEESVGVEAARRSAASGSASLVPHIASCVDDIAFVHSMVAKSNVHGPATFMQNTGFVLPGFPAHGGVGLLRPGQHERKSARRSSCCRTARGFAPNGPGNWSAGFLPAAHQGTMIRAGSPNPIFDLFPPKDARTITPESEAARGPAAPRSMRTSRQGIRATRAWRRASPPTSWPRSCSSARRRCSTSRASPPLRARSTDWTTA